VLDLSYIKNALYHRFSLYRHNQHSGELQFMVKGEKKGKDDNKILGFLMGLGAGAIVYSFLSLFAKPKCPICQTAIKKDTSECPHCHSKLKWR
jgi:hypothetical protein